MMLCRALQVSGGIHRMSMENMVISGRHQDATLFTMPYKCLRLCGGVRSLKTTSMVFSSHYDVLGITPRATQSDIKAAYYKLSKMYHPDISSDEESAKKFRSISEAYEVLGNVRLKKMYDKGLIVATHSRARMDYNPDPEPTDPTEKFFKSRTRNYSVTMDGRTPIYDFDTWSKNHYGDLFARSQYEKELIRKKQKKHKDAQKSNTQENILYVFFALGGLMLLFSSGRDDYDKDRVGRSPQNQETESK